MPWWHVDYEPFALSTGYALERIGHSLVVGPGNERRPDFFNEFYEPCATKFFFLELLQLV